MLLPGSPVVPLVGVLCRLEVTLGLADLLENALNVCLQRLLQGAELLVEGGLGTLGFIEGGLLLRVFEALAFDGLAALGQVLFGADQGGPLFVQVGCRILELGGGSGDGIDIM